MTKKKSKGTVKPKENSTDDTSKMQKILGHRVRIKHKNQRQKEFTTLIGEKEIVIATGVPGTGKSYLSIGKALELVQNKSNNYSKIKIVKPAVEAEENLGFLPGDLKEKLQPHLASSMDIIDKIIGEQNRIKMEDEGIISVEPLGFVRGKTLDNSIVIIEEAQNISPHQMKTLLTRIGKNSKYIISGDLGQSDRFKRFTDTGLYDIIMRLKTMDEIGLFVFNPEDIVRNPLISKILNKYGKDDNFIDLNIFDKPTKKEKNNEEEFKPNISKLNKLLINVKYKLYKLSI